MPLAPILFPTRATVDMDRTNTSVSNRRLRRGWMSQTDTSTLNSSSRSPDTNSETRNHDSESKNTGWARIYFAPKLFVIQMYSLLRFSHSGGRPPLPSASGRFRSIMKWIAILYLGFSVFTSRPFDAYNNIVYCTEFFFSRTRKRAFLFYTLYNL